MRSTSRRRGLTYLEVQTAFAVLGVALAGLGPVVIAQLRLMARFERRFPSGATHYLVPSTDPWARKLGAAARLTASEPGPSVVSPPASTPAVNLVAVESFASSAHLDTAEAVVAVTPVETPP